MRLIPDWRRVLARAWSVRLLALLILFSGLEVALPFFDGALPISDRMRGLIYFAVTALATVLRVMPQRSLTPKD